MERCRICKDAALYYITFTMVAWLLISDPYPASDLAFGSLPEDHIMHRAVELFDAGGEFYFGHAFLLSGRAGDPIVIRVVNETGLVSLDVAIDRQDGTDIEKGQAIELGIRSGKWVYTATQPVARGSDVFIEVVGVDYTGKKFKMTENPVVEAEA